MAIMPAQVFDALVRGRHPAAMPAGQLRTRPAAKAKTGLLPDLSLTEHLLLPVAIFAVSAITIAALKYSNLVATVWPSNAIMIAVLLCRARSLANYASVIIIGSAAAALASWLDGNSAALCATFMVGNAVEVATAMALLALLGVNSSNLTSFSGILAFILLVASLSPIGGTVISAYAYGLARGIPWVVVWRNWYPGHALGMIILVPFLVSVLSKEWQTLRLKERIPETTVVLVIFVAITVCVDFFRPVIFLLAPTILLATIWFGVIGATAATFLVAVTASVFVVLDIGKPLLIVHPDLSQRLFALQAFLAITSFWSLPTAALLAERDRLLRDLSHANSQLEADSERKSHLVIGLRRHLSVAEENERLRLSHDLHDQAGQSLIGAILELNEIDSLTSGPAHRRLHLLRKRMEELGKTLHRIAWELRPPSLQELGLRKALASYIGEWGEQYGTTADFHCDDAKLDDVPDEIATALYRIVQEALTNIVKHARNPSDVSVVIRRADGTLQLIIEDDGCGFDIAERAAKSGKQRGLGLDGMRERLSLIGGTLDVESAIGTGTTIFARITLDGDGRSA